MADRALADLSVSLNEAFCNRGLLFPFMLRWRHYRVKLDLCAFPSSRDRSREVNMNRAAVRHLRRLIKRLPTDVADGPIYQSLAVTLGLPDMRAVADYLGWPLYLVRAEQDNRCSRAEWLEHLDFMLKVGLEGYEDYYDLPESLLP